MGEPTWAGPNGVDSIVYYRQITAIDSERNIITIDVPIRHALLMRDGARTYKLGSVVSELGLQDFSIGMKENTKPNSDDGKDKPDVGKAWGENDHSKEGTKGWIVISLRFS